MSLPSRQREIGPSSYIVTMTRPNPADWWGEKFREQHPLPPPEAYANRGAAGVAMWQWICDQDYRQLAEDVHVGSHLDTISALPESGGTVGPLPDGTVIEVRRA